MTITCDTCDRKFLYIKGITGKRFCSRKCHLKQHNTLKHQRKAGRAGGAIKISLRGTGTKTYVKEFGRHQHRVVMERILGRTLTFQEVVHHKDGDKHNNHPQ